MSMTLTEELVLICLKIEAKVTEQIFCFVKEYLTNTALFEAKITFSVLFCGKLICTQTLCPDRVFQTCLGKSAVL